MDSSHSQDWLLMEHVGGPVAYLLNLVYRPYHHHQGHLLDLVYLDCPTVDKEYWKHVTIRTVRSCIYGRCYEHALLTSITCGRNRQNVNESVQAECGRRV